LLAAHYWFTPPRLQCRHRCFRESAFGSAKEVSEHNRGNPGSATTQSLIQKDKQEKVILCTFHVSFAEPRATFERILWPRVSRSRDALRGAHVITKAEPHHFIREARSSILTKFSWFLAAIF